MMRKQRFLLMVCLSIVLHYSYAQTGENAIGKVKIASPNAAALGKFVDIPVNYYTGIPDITIPIYTIKEGPLQLPISLSYHASGLKVQEQASWVGAGWALNAGGVITRTVRGAPDEKMTSSIQQVYGHLSDNGYLSYILKDENGNPILIPPSGEQFIRGEYDGEADLFFFNFNGYTGKFYFNDDGSVFLLPQGDLKIEQLYTPQLLAGSGGFYESIRGFIITTPDGTKYYFGNTGSLVTSPYVQPIETTGQYTLHIGIDNGSRVTSSWFLNKIVSVDGNFFINLKYTKDTYAYYVINSSRAPEMCSSNNGDSYDLVKNLFRGVKLSQITFSNGKVDFVPGPSRDDLSAYDATPTTITDFKNTISPSLGEIQISDNATGGFCKKFSFLYNYFTDNTTALPPFCASTSITTDKKRLRLDNIQESSCDLTAPTSIPPYHFEYYTTQSPPRTTSFAMDHWGFYNGANNADLLPQLKSDGYTVYSSTTVRESAYPAMKAGTLTNITYPTGGSVEYIYEPNTFIIKNQQNVDEEKIVGGLRIKAINQSDGIKKQTTNQNSLIVTNFDYTDYTGKSSSILYGKPTYIQKARNDFWKSIGIWGYDNQNGCYPGSCFLYLPYSIQPMDNTQGYHLGYSQVNVSQTGNGSTTYTYYGTLPQNIDRSGVAVIDASMTCSPSTPSYPPVPLATDFKRGLLKKVWHYNENKISIKEEEYIYDFAENPIGVPGCIYALVPGTSPNYNTVFAASYELKTSKKTHEQIIETVKNPGLADNITFSDTWYDNANHNKPTKIRTTTSTEFAQEKRIKYAAEFIPSSVQSLSNCGTTPYGSTYNTFPAAYQTLINNCKAQYPSYDQNYWSCVGGVYYMNYLKSISDARKQWISCRKQNILNTTPLSNYQTAHNTAKANANTELKPILWMQDINMNAPIEISSWRIDDLNHETLTGSIYNQFSNFRDDQYGVNMAKTMSVNLSAASSSLTNAVIGSDGISITKDTRYKDLSFYDFDKGSPISIQGRGGVSQSYEWGYNLNFPIVKIDNALNDNKEMLATREIAPPNVKSIVEFQFDLYNQTINKSINFTQDQAWPIMISLQDGAPFANVSMHYKLTGPGATVNEGDLCKSKDATTCGITTVTFANKPAGAYSLVLTGQTSISSFAISFNAYYTYHGFDIFNNGIKEFFYDGFEENTSSNAITGTPHTGTKYWKDGVNYIVPFTKPNTKKYVLQAWTLTNGKWIFNQVNYTNGMAIPGPCDDIRVFPEDAQISTYTYSPMKGITSEINAAGYTKEYEYDALGRLKLIRDQDKNILSKYCYNYAGQSVACDGQSFGNKVQNTNLFNQGCGTGYVADPYSVTVAANTFFSTVSKDDANAMAVNYINTTLQTQANQNGTCSLITNVAVKYTNNPLGGLTGFTVVYTSKTTPPVQYSFNIPSTATSGTLGSVPSGNYDITISKTNNTVNYNFSTCESPTVYYVLGAPFATFYNIPIRTSFCNTINLATIQ